VWGNWGPNFSIGPSNQISGAQSSVTYSIVTGWTGGTGNSSGNPQFLNPAVFDYRLQASSPAIDAGSSAALPAEAVLDLGGRPRIVDDPTVPDSGPTSPAVDIGAHEWAVPTVGIYCFGDGLGTPCPCANHSAPGSQVGCLNSLGLGGRLRASGVARLATDTLVLHGSQMPNSTALYFQGTMQPNAGFGSHLGDGLRCASAQVVRLATKNNDLGMSNYPEATEPSISVRGQVTAPGSLRNYQVWYRNAAPFCQTATFNTSNGVQVTWEL
jgi:hypothetical protein